MNSDPAERAILDVLAARAGKSICPSEAARALTGSPKDSSWRRGMAPVRLAYMRLAAAGRIEILRKGKPVTPEAARGVVRLRLVGE
jgi:hypothetical protein